jgi:hypothetical protein
MARFAYDQNSLSLTVLYSRLVIYFFSHIDLGKLTAPLNLQIQNQQLHAVSLTLLLAIYFIKLPMWFSLFTG